MINGVTTFDQNPVVGSTNNSTTAPVTNAPGSSPAPTIPPQQPRKSVPVKYIIAIIVMLLLVVGGIAAYFLTQSNTDLRQQASTGDFITQEVDGTPTAPPPGGYNIRCSSQAANTTGSTFAINWDCWGGEHFQWARPDRADWPGYPATKPWKIAGWHCPRPNTSDPNNPKTCNYGDPGAVRVFITDKNTLSYAQGRRDGNGGDGSPCDINSPDQTHCIYHNVTSSTITANAYNNCGFFQADIFVPHPSGQLWDFGGTMKYQVLGAFVKDFGNYDNCTRSTPTPTPTVQCPTGPKATCYFEADGSISANLSWSGGTLPITTKYLIRADHQPGNVAQCINPTSQQPVGWYCPATTTTCLPGQVCDDRYVYYTGSATKLTNIKNGDTYNWALQVDPNGCRIEAGSFRCARTVIPSPSPSPSPTPVVYSCNSTCTTDAQCKTANANFICYRPGTTTNRTSDVLGVSTEKTQMAATAPVTGTGNVIRTGASPSPVLSAIGNCRLASNPTSTTCQATIPTPSPTPRPTPSPTPTPRPTPSPTPVVGPMCLNVTLNSPNNPPKLGDTITLTCGAVTGVTEYQFRVRQPNGEIVALSAAGGSRTSVAYQIASQGKYAAQCRICVHNDKGIPICQEWEPMSGAPAPSPSPVSCTPMPLCVLTQACDVPEPAGGWCPTPSPSPVVQCSDEKCAQTVFCYTGGYSYCSTTAPTIGQCVCPDGAAQNKTDAEKTEEAAAATQETKAE